MVRNQRTRALICLFMALAMFFVWGCASRRGLPQPKRVWRSADMPGATKTPKWDVAAIGYEYLGKGMDYSKTDLDPVLLVLVNKGEEEPQVVLDEVRGLGTEADYMVYSVDAAARLVHDSERFSIEAESAAKAGGVGMIIGAGLGALIGLISGGGAAVWQGALIGGGSGAAAGVISSVAAAEHELDQAVRQELEDYVWDESPIAPNLSRAGYLYLPAGKGIETVSVAIRSAGQTETHVLRIDRTGKARKLEQEYEEKTK